MNRINREEPYIVQLSLDSRSHLIIERSSGGYEDAGYMPSGSLSIHVRRDEHGHNN